MRSIEVPESLLAEIGRHARDSYPDECCGFLVSDADPENPRAPRRILAVERAANEFQGERRRRFVIRPAELAAAERRWQAAGRLIAGFYHSHPDHPARPSAFDREHAWPWYTYLVAAITREDLPAVGAFELDADTREFREVRMQVVRDVPGVTEGLRAAGAR